MKRFLIYTSILFILFIALFFLRKIFCTQSDYQSLSNRSASFFTVQAYTQSISNKMELIEIQEKPKLSQAKSHLVLLLQKPLIPSFGRVININDSISKIKIILKFQYKITLIKIRDSFIIWSTKSQEIRENILTWIERSLYASMSYQSAQLILGMVFGQSVTWSDSMSHSIKVIGIQHIFSASGYNLSVISAFLLTFAPVSTSKKGFGGLLIVVTLFYAWIAGFGPSLLRAFGLFLYSLMGLKRFLGVSTHRFMVWE